MSVITSNRRFKMFNAGDRIQQTLKFSNPDGHDPHCICFYPFDAPSGKVFSVPETINLGGALVHVHFVDDLLRDFGTRGLILIDANIEPPLKSDEETGELTKDIDEEAYLLMPVARTEDEARAKGKTLWTRYCADAVQKYLEQCETIRAGGGVPIAATGWMARALKAAGIIDPAQAMLVESKKQTSVVEALREELKKSNEERERVLQNSRDREDRLMQRLEALENANRQPKQEKTPTPKPPAVAKENQQKPAELPALVGAAKAT